jgi:hypothetical protein
VHPEGTAVIAPDARLPAVSPFLVLGLVGFATGSGLAVVAAARSGGSPATVVGMAAVSVLTFFVVAFATKVVTGVETLTFYHHALAMALGVTVFLVGVGAPVLRNLDYAVLGLIGFLVFGRLGCTMVGCCYGRPASWGVSYGPELERQGFPHHLVGVLLLPVQAVESLACAIIAAVAMAGIVGGWPPGLGLVWSGGAYAVARFALEFWRGDERRYRAGLSAPQRTSLWIAALLAALSLTGVLPGAVFVVPLVAVLVVGASAVAVGRWRGRGSLAELVGPEHVHEIAGVLDACAAVRGAGSAAPGPTTWVTRGGLVLSTGLHPGDGDDAVLSYSLSHLWSPLDERTATRLAKTIMWLRHPDRDYSIVRGRAEVFHLLVVGDRVGAAR